MDKMKVAHEMALEIVKLRPELMAWQIADRAWEYFDAMQAEADKREKAEAEQKRKEIRKILDDPNIFIEREGQHFDDVCEDKTRPEALRVIQQTFINGVEQPRYAPSHEEWQPDWSQAPEWANCWAMDMDKNCYWYEDKLHLGDVEWDRHSLGKSFRSKPYGYQGDWKESLRRRPEVLCEVDWRVAPIWAKYWAVRDGSDTALWCINKPTVTADCLLSHGGCSPAPLFGFTGSHIVERPL